VTTESIGIARARPVNLSDWLVVFKIAGYIVLRVIALVVALVLLAKVRSGSGVLLHGAVIAVSLTCIYIALGKGFRVWALYVVGFVAFAQLRAYGDEIGTPVQYDYVITAEKLLFFGTLPTNWLQDWFYEYRRAGVLEVYTMFVYLFYFFAPHIVAFALWKWDFPRFQRFGLAFLVTIYLGLLTCAVLPTAPPWLAGQEGRIPHVYQIMPDILIDVTPGTYQQAYEVAGSNPVAAMPSLHAAIPFVMMFALWKYPLARWVGVWYAASMPFAIVYLGEHYFVDALAGLAAAWAGWQIAGRAIAWWDGRESSKNAGAGKGFAPTPASPAPVSAPSQILGD
jgi:PAP2 superfamily